MLYISSAGLVGCSRTGGRQSASSTQSPRRANLKRWGGSALQKTSLL